MNFALLEKAIKFYQKRGYAYLTEVPWFVHPDIVRITCQSGMVIDDAMQMVASGEQSFLQMIDDGLLREGKYSCVTPCYRPHDNQMDGLHLPCFYKLELISYCATHVGKELDDMLYHAKEFLTQCRNGERLKIVKTQDDLREGCKTITSYDIETRKGIELGSYGVRWTDKNMYWVYGTGVAIPRVSYQLKPKKKVAK